MDVWKKNREGGRGRGGVPRHPFLGGGHPDVPHLPSPTLGKRFPGTPHPQSMENMGATAPTQGTWLFYKAENQIIETEKTKDLHGVTDSPIAKPLQIPIH